MSERVKLKRGLSDISPLFGSTVKTPRTRVVLPREEEADSAPVPGSEVFFIWSVDDEGDAHFLNNFFASKLVSPYAPALLVTAQDLPRKAVESIRKESWSRSLHRISMPAKKLSEAFATEKGDFPSSPRDAQVFLEMSVKVLLEQPDVAKALDQFVLFVKPQMDSVTEAYRKLKCLASFGMRADIALLFDAEDTDETTAKLYELFSDFISRKLSLPVNYLGTLHLSRSTHGLRQNIGWNGWNALRRVRAEEESPVVEKVKFLNWLEKLHAEEIAK